MAEDFMPLLDRDHVEFWVGNAKQFDLEETVLAYLGQDAARRRERVLS